MAWIVNLILFVLPPSPGRCQWLKRWLLKIAGNDVAKNAKIMRIRVQGVQLIVGDGTFIGDETMFMGSAGTKITVGPECDISSRVTFVTGTHHFAVGTVKCAGQGYGEDINIGRGVWIGACAVILPGVTIGDGAMVAAGAIVNRSIPPFEIWGGCPAKFIKRREE